MLFSQSDNFWNELEAEYDGDPEYVEAQVSLSGVNGTEVIDQVGIRTQRQLQHVPPRRQEIIQN